MSVFIILNKRVSVGDGQPRCVGGINILLKISFFVMLKGNNSLWEANGDKINCK